MEMGGKKPKLKKSLPKKNQHKKNPAEY